MLNLLPPQQGAVDGPKWPGLHIRLCRRHLGRSAAPASPPRAAGGDGTAGRPLTRANPRTGSLAGNKARIVPRAGEGTARGEGRCAAPRQAAARRSQRGLLQRNGCCVWLEGRKCLEIIFFPHNLISFPPSWASRPQNGAYSTQ